MFVGQYGIHDGFENDCTECPQNYSTSERGSTSIDNCTGQN